MHCILGLLIFLLMPLFAKGDPAKTSGISGVITGIHVNVRVKPGTRFEVLGQLRKDLPVTVVREQDGWIGIKSPESIRAWVAGHRVAAGRITEANVPLYAGPGIVYTRIAMLQKGDRVDVAVNKGNPWLRIRLPADTLVWVHRDFVAWRPPIPDDPITKPEPAAVAEASAAMSLLKGPTTPTLPPPATTRKPHTEAPAYNAPEPEMPAPPAKFAAPPTAVGKTSQTDVLQERTDDKTGAAGAASEPETASKAVEATRVNGERKAGTAGADVEIRIHNIRPQPTREEIVYIGEAPAIEKLGIVIPLGKKASPWAYALAVFINDTYYPMAYLTKKPFDPEQWKWKRVQVTGTQRWVRGWPRPLIEVASIRAYEPLSNRGDSPEIAK